MAVENYPAPSDKKPPLNTALLKQQQEMFDDIW